MKPYIDHRYFENPAVLIGKLCSVFGRYEGCVIRQNAQQGDDYGKNGSGFEDFFHLPELWRLHLHKTKQPSGIEHATGKKSASPEDANHFFIYGNGHQTVKKGKQSKVKTCEQVVTPHCRAGRTSKRYNDDISIAYARYKK